MAVSEDYGDVLILENEPGSATSLATGVGRHADDLVIETAERTRDGLDTLVAGNFDSVVATHDPQGLDALDALRAVRSADVDVPVILYFPDGTDRLVEKAISAGVSDYVLGGGGRDDHERVARRIELASARPQTGDVTPRESDRLLQELIETTNDVLWMFTADWNDLLFVNSAYEDLWGRSRKALEDSPRDWLKGIDPGDRDRVKAAMDRLSSGESIDIEYRVRPDEDSRRWGWVQGEPIRGETGDVERVAGFVRDVTERKEKEQELERYETIVENTEDGVYVFDQDCRFTFVNQRVADISGIPRDAWNGEHLSILEDLDTLTGTDVSDIERGIHDILRGRKEVVRLDLSPDVPSDLRHLELRLTPLRGAEGPDRVIGFSRDITERLEREQELARKNERLEEFASIVSHDLRNPLNVASGRLELGRQEFDSEHFQQVAGALDRMDSLIDELLTVARSGDLVTETDPVSLESVSEHCWRTVETNGVALVTEADLPTVSADRNGIQQLLENLFRNAIEHGGETETISVGPLETGTGFYVEDDGSGIPEPDRAAVFEWGYSSSNEGTGLGLTIVEEITNAHGWDVAVTESDEGGARLEFSGVDLA